MIQAGSCPECGAAMPDDAPEGLCPQCLLHEGLETGQDTPVRGSAAPTAVYQGPFTAPAPADLARLFPQLEILALLGQGGMGAVYKARQVKLDRLVALKILPPQLGRDPAFAERFIREARTLAKLNHPDIVAVYDFGETEGFFFFLMEFVDGMNLRQRLQAGPLQPDEALQIVRQVCDALQYAHEMDIVHRDIKPENILLDKSGRVKIADFGLAKLVGLTPTYLTLTGSHQVMGTLYYMAPEQMERPSAVDHRADIYSLGVVFYEMLTGGLPVGRFALPSQKGQVDRELDQIILRALEKEPERRYQRVSDLKKNVEGLNPAIPTAVSVEQAPLAVPVFIPLPFAAHGAWATAEGMIRLEGPRLILEYVVKDRFVGVIKSGLKETKIPLKDISSISLEKGWTTTALVIRAARLSVLADVPSSSQGEVKLQLARKDREAAEQLVELVMGQLCREPGLRVFRPAAQPAASRLAADYEMIRVGVRGAAGGLLVTGIASGLTWTLILYLVHSSGMLVGGSWVDRPLGVVYPGLFFAVAIPVLLILFGALRMRKCVNYEFAVMASMLAMLPWSPAWIIGLPMGIWALRVLRKPEVKAAFAGTLDLEGPAMPECPRQIPAATPQGRNPARGKMKSFFRSVRYYCFDSLRGSSPAPTADYHNAPCHAETPTPPTSPS